LVKNFSNIKTPDQKLRVFISSTLKELSDERTAVKNSVERLKMIPVMFELGARPHPPKDLYLAYLSQSDIFIGIYWQSYGWIAENESVSGIEDEYRASEYLPRLIYVKEPSAQREQRLIGLLDQMRSSGRVSYKSFSTPKELEKIVADDLAILISERFYSEEKSGYVQSEYKKTHTNLPQQLLPIIGRENDIREIVSLVKVKDQKLITISGPGGIGKTKLALSAAHSLSEIFDEGVYFIDLSEIKDRHSIFLQIGNTLGINISETEDPVKQISDFISSRKILLVLDNFEQLSAHSTAVSSLIYKCPNLCIIITSRSSLNITIEFEYRLSALSFPSESDEYDKISESPSVKLFLSKAETADSKFMLNEKNYIEVSAICRMLEGIPLAIGLAAAKVRIFSPKMILERLSSKLSLLSSGSPDAPARHKTMKAAIEWSYDLLNEEEKILFRRLAVFNEGFDYTAAEKICCNEFSDPSGLIESLLLKYLIKKDYEVNDNPRYSMPLLFLEYARELFNESDEGEMIKLKHADYFYEKAIKESENISSIKNINNLRYWGFDAANVIDAAGTFYSQKKYAELVNLIYSLWHLFWIFDFETELDKKIDICKLLKEATGLDDEDSAKLSWIAGAASLGKGDSQTAETLLKNALDFFKSSSNLRGFAWSLHLLTTIKAASQQGKTNKEILKDFEEALKLFRQCDDYWGETGVLMNTAAFETVLKHYSKSLKLYDEFETLSWKAENLQQIAHINFMRAWNFINMKKSGSALICLKLGMELYKDGDYPEGTCYALIISSYYFFKKGNDNKAMFIAGVYENIQNKFRFTPWQMILSVTGFLKKKIIKINKSGDSGEYEKGLNMGIFKAIRTVNEIIQSEE